MGIYLNPGGSKFYMSCNAQIYIDKSTLISKLNPLIETEDRFVCVSRPRRFGKTMAANMLAAYYSCDEDTHALFDNLKISEDLSYQMHLNKHMVLQLNMQNFLSENDSVEGMLGDLQKEVITELKEYFPGVIESATSMPRAFEKIYAKTKQTFIILIDEWDCLFREYKNDVDAHKKYLDFLRNWLKDRAYVGLAYMTGILPIKKYGSHSALNMFNEFSMVSPGNLTEYFGFTEMEVQDLCKKYQMEFEKAKLWYDGYSLISNEKVCAGEGKEISIYSPKSVSEAMKRGSFAAYWNQTETYEALKIYIQMNFDGLKDAVVAMLAGDCVRVNIDKFTNDMTSLNSKDDVLTLLIHLGYLTYDGIEGTVRIPNKEVAKEYLNAIEDTDGLDSVAKTAFYYARECYTIVRELPSGKGFADVCFLPRRKHTDKPAIVIELKWDKTADAAIRQIKDKKYPEILQDYSGNLLLAGINYDKVSKKHDCVIEKFYK